MAIATAPVDFEAYDRPSKPTPLDGPALEALKACAELRSASLDALRSLARQATLRSVGRGANVGAQGTRLDAAVLVVRGGSAWLAAPPTVAGLVEVWYHDDRRFCVASRPAAEMTQKR
jgi:hypothetical protein